jgi:hypothetical protein
MIFTEKFLFIHVPKMAGMTLTAYLLNNLKGQMVLSVPEPAQAHAIQSIKFGDVGSRLKFHAGIRHEDLHAAARVLEFHGRTLDSFEKVIALVRDPYDLEKSYFSHMQKKTVQALRGQGNLAVRLAIDGDFEAFAEQAPFYGHLPSKIERFYRLRDGIIPANLEIVRFEHLPSFEEAVGPYCHDRMPLGHANKSTQNKSEIPISVRAEAAIFKKYQFLFSHYDRLAV